MSAPVKILISGATGYIGGSILSEILRSKDASKYSISALIRHEKQAKALEDAGVKPVLFKGLDDLDGCRKAAREHDVVIGAASASHTNSAKALIQGLGDRKKATGDETYYIHTSGTSIMGDRCISGTFVDIKVYSDVKDDIYAFEKDHKESYSQRVVDLAVVETGESEGVKTFIVVPPTIFGRGTGLFLNISQQIPNLIRLSIKKGHAVVIGEGKGIWNHVHISDLSALYLLLLQGILATQTDLPYCKQGIYFAETGEHTWLSVSDSIAKALHAKGTLTSSGVKSISLEEAAAEFTGGDERIAEITLASNSRTRADLAKQVLGWKPEHGDESFYGHFTDEVAVVAKDF